MIACRQDPQLLDRMINLLQTNFAELSKNKDKKGVFQCGLKVLCLLIIKGKVDDENRIDIVKNILIPNLLVTHLK